jgi:hypothetical protein
MTGAFLLMALATQPGQADDWAMKTGPLMTRWAAQVDPNAPLPDYPRPQMTRPDWLNLNGVWEFQPGAEGDAAPVGKTLDRKILVPFPVESAISGVMEHHKRLWYRRTFEVPAGWAGRRVLLHFGAVDYESEVLVNGRSAGTHRGGYDPFVYDITEFLQADGPQELIVRVFDPTVEGGQPRGKQTTRPGGIMYTPTTGIWQTVWLEPVAAEGIRALKITPDVDSACVWVAVDAAGNLPHAQVHLTAKAGAQVVATADGAPGTREIRLNIPNAKLWSPESPFLYDLDVTVTAGRKELDRVGSYFGMRSIRLGEVNGVKKPLLNGKFVFQFGPLDQGFWPDGIYTAPTDEALRYDIEMTRQLGFNMIRKHIKVEPLRWYYWADKLGLLIWQDMPSANSYRGDQDPQPPVDREAYERELSAMIANLYNTPSIIQWQTYNEGQGQYDTPRLVSLVKRLDPTRLVNEASGGGDTGSGDVHDIHSYPPPACPNPDPNRALACGEFGGIGFRVEGHNWAPGGGGYTNVQTPQDLIDLYVEFSYMLRKFRDEKGLSAAVYTQATDVETEINGLMTYDRVPKMDVATIAKANRFELAPPTYTTVVPTSEKQAQTWKYTLERPADGWERPEFDASAWNEGRGVFGSPGTPGIDNQGTEWTTRAIWLRRSFNPGPLTAEQIDRLMIRDNHDEDVRVYINGVLAYEAGGFFNGYETRPIRPEARKAIRPGQDNVLAVQCRQSEGGQSVDVGLVLRDIQPDQAGR